MKKALVKTLSVILSIMIMITALPLVGIDLFTEVNAETTNIQIGDTITLGTYYSKPIVWRCVDIDENGPLMLSEEILCYKEFDAAGTNSEYHSDGWGYIRKDRGSNCWYDANIRQWLNTAGTVEYTHCPPSYKDESGFLSNFDSQELKLIKSVTQKTYINSWETTRTGYCDGGTKETTDIWNINSLGVDYSTCYYQNVTDMFFFLNQEQLYNVYMNDPKYLHTGLDGIMWWTRIAGNSGASYENIFVPVGDSVSMTITHPNNTSCGVRPAFYLNDEVYNGGYKNKIISGIFNSYTITVLQDTPTVGESVSFVSSAKIDEKEYVVKEGCISDSALADSFKDKKVIATINNFGEIVRIVLCSEENETKQNWHDTSTANKNYGVEEKKTKSTYHIAEANKALYSAMDNYIATLGAEAGEATVDIEKMVKELESNENEYFSITTKDDKVIESVYYCLAKFIVEIANNNQLYLEVDPEKSSDSQAIKLINTLSKHFRSASTSYTYGDYRVTLNVTLASAAFAGSIDVYKYKGKNIGTSYTGLVSSGISGTKEVMVAYANNLGEIVKDECKYALASVYSNFMDLSGLAKAEEDFLSNFFNAKLTETLSKGGYGAVFTMFENMRKSYDIIKTFETLAFGETIDLSVAESLYKKINEIDFSLGGAKKSAVKRAINRVMDAKKDLQDALYNYIENTDTGDPENMSWWEKLNRAIMQCPVEFEVYDSNGNLIGFVNSSEESEEYIYFTDDIYIDVVGDAKYLYYPTDMDISIKVIAYEDGEMNYTIEQIEDGVATGRINYVSVPLTAGVAYEQTIPANVSLEENYSDLNLSNDEYNIPGTYYDADDETANVTINCDASVGGFVINDGTHPIGDNVNLFAFTDAENKEFIGWYENGYCVSTDVVYQITANKNVDLIAVFDDEHEHVYEAEATVEPKCEEEGTIEYVCDCCDSYIYTIPASGHNFVNGVCTECGDRTITLEEMSSQIRFDRNDDGSYAGTFDVRTRAMISDEDFNALVGVTNEEAIENIDKVGFVYTVDGENFSTASAQAVAQGETVAGYVDAPVSYIQDADGYYMFTCLVTDIPSADVNNVLVSYAYICVEDENGNEKWYFMETQAEADFNSLYTTYYPVACEKYGWE